MVEAWMSTSCRPIRRRDCCVRSRTWPRTTATTRSSMPRHRESRPSRSNVTRGRCRLSPTGGPRSSPPTPRCRSVPSKEPTTSTILPRSNSTESCSWRAKASRPSSSGSDAMSATVAEDSLATGAWLASGDAGVVGRRDRAARHPRAGRARRRASPDHRERLASRSDEHPDRSCPRAGRRCPRSCRLRARRAPRRHRNRPVSPPNGSTPRPR